MSMRRGQSVGGGSEVLCEGISELCEVNGSIVTHCATKVVFIGVLIINRRVIKVVDIIVPIISHGGI